MYERLKAFRQVKYERMPLAVRLKYSKDKPSLKIHVWDMFDEEVINTKTLDKLFKNIYSRFEEIHAELCAAGAKFDIEGNYYESACEDENLDSAEEKFLNDLR